MRDIKEKVNKPREKPRRLKERGGSIKRAVGGQIGKLMKDRYRKEQAKNQLGRESDAAVSAEEQVEQYTGQSFTTVADSASRGMDRVRRTVKGRRTAKPDAAMPEQPDNPRTPTPGERMKQAAIKEKKEQVIKGKGDVSAQTPPFSASIAPDANAISPADPPPVYHPPAGKAGVCPVQPCRTTVVADNISSVKRVVTVEIIHVILAVLRHIRCANHTSAARAEHCA